MQVEQGVGLGSDKPLFNRLRATATHFHQIGQTVPGEAPKSLVIHSKGGACIGDQPPYELFTLGGPFSVGSCCRASLHAKIEVALVRRTAVLWLSIKHRNVSMWVQEEGSSVRRVIQEVGLFFTTGLRTIKHSLIVWDKTTKRRENNRVVKLGMCVLDRKLRA